VHTLRINRMMTDGVVEAPNGAHFTSCDPDYGRDETFQKEYASTDWSEFKARYIDVDEAEYLRLVNR
jgi:glutaconate CoA-transferase, subunit A